MYKIFLTFMLLASLNAKMIGGVAVVVKGDAITLYEIKEEMELSKIDAQTATNLLIRKVLEKQEVQNRKISVSSSEVYDDIKKTAARNNLSVGKFYEAIRESNGLTSSELKVKIKEKLLSQKLYGAIAYSSISQPSDEEIETYYNAHKDSYTHPSGFKAVVYQAKDQARLQQKISNPMFYSPDISSAQQDLPYDRISPELASLLQKTALNSFTPIVSDGQGGYMSFYLQEIQSSKDVTLQTVKNQIVNTIMGEQREQVLGDYFARLRHNADVKILREVE